MPDLLTYLARMADAVIAVDGEQRILLVNRAAEALLGLTARDVLGKLCYDVLRGRDKLGAVVCNRACHAIAQAKRAEQIPTTHLLTPTKAGHELWLNVSHFALPLIPSGQVAVIHIFRDVSRQVTMEQVVHHFAATLAGLCAPGQADSGRPDLGAQLTHRERQVLERLAEGLDTPAISAKLSVSRSTVRTHIQHILAKLGVHSRLQAVALAARRRLL